MRIRRLHLLARIGLFALVWAGLSGCFLRGALGNIEYVGTIGDGIQDYVHSFFSDTSGGSCVGSASPPHNVFIDCFYIIDGLPISSTVSLLSNLGIYGVFIDPLILEVPSNVISVTATYDNGGGPQPLPVGRAGSFQVHPGLWITAQVGTTFLFLDLPRSVDPDADISYSLSYHRLLPPGPPPPAVIKPMLAGVVIAQNQIYYIPLLPCVTDFADVPAVTIPESDTPQPLDMTLGDLIRNHDASPCDHVVHDFSGALPPPGLVFLPVVLR
jgi:hypothetical protein